MEHKRKVVLIVEDSAVQALSLMRLLQSHNLEVKWATDGRMGIRLAQQHRPDLIVMDMEMPEMNGLEACKRLKGSTRTCDIPVVMLTVRNELDSLSASLDLGVIDFVPKDAFSESVLLETMRQLGVLTGADC